MDLFLLTRPHGRQPVNLVEKDDARLGVFGFVKEEAELAFCFADPFAQAVGALAHEKGDFAAFGGAGCCEGAGHEGFSGSGGAVEEDSSGWGDVEALEDFGVEEGEGDHLFQLSDV
jgi:hypothetical protein